MTRFTRFPLRLLVVAAMTFSLVALAPAVAATSPQSGHLHVTKECSEYFGAAGEFCTITSSDIKAIKVGSRVVYLEAAGAAGLESAIIVRHGNSIAYGHVSLDFATGTGTVTLSGGTKKFRWFSASIYVTFTGGDNWAWDGTYSFSPPI